MTYYKVLNQDGSCYHGGYGIWPENEWMPELDEAKLEPCRYGYHILEAHDLVYWLGPAIAPVEIPATARIVRQSNKLVVATAKRGPFLTTWNSTTQRLFAVDCAEHVLHIYESNYPNDDRPRKAIDVARRFALGKATLKELNAAVATAAYAPYTAAYTAAADAATYATEREWQTERLWQYLDGEISYES